MACVNRHSQHAVGNTLATILELFAIRDLRAILSPTVHDAVQILGPAKSCHTNLFSVFVANAGHARAHMGFQASTVCGQVSPAQHFQIAYMRGPS